MSSLNLTSMLSSPSDWSSHSPVIPLGDPTARYSRLMEMVQRFNRSNYLPNLTESELMSAIMNQSAYEAHFAQESTLNDEAANNSQQEVIPWIRVTLCVVYAAIFVLGVCGNALVCYAVARNSQMHTVTNVFISNLAFSDILLSIFAAPITPLYLLIYKEWHFGTALCHLLPFAQGASIYISAFTLMSIAIDRYKVIMHPLKPRMQMGACIGIIVAIWLITISITFPYAYFMKLFEVPKNEDTDEIVLYCDEQWPNESLRLTYTVLTSILQFVIPFTIITYCYVNVCGKLWDRTKTIPGSVSARREEQERERARRTNTMLICMVICFVLSWSGLNIYNLLMDFVKEANQWQHHATAFLVLHAIAMSSVIYNPILYAVLNENFRKEFKEILPCCAKLFTSASVAELRPQNSQRSSCTNSSKRCVKLHLAEDNGKEKNSLISSEQMRMESSVAPARAPPPAELCLKDQSNQHTQQTSKVTLAVSFSNGSNSSEQVSTSATILVEGDRDDDDEQVDGTSTSS